MRLLDLCNDVPDSSYLAKNRIRSKHVDFLLCHPATLTPVVAIEVDGPSHKSAKQAKSDDIKNAFFAEIGLPFVRVPAVLWFEPSEVLSRVEVAISEG